MIVTTLGNTISEAITTFSVTVSIDAIRFLGWGLTQRT
jgi:hypothetical protein